MPVYAIVYHQTDTPISKTAYTTADSAKTAVANFTGKWRMRTPGIPSPRELRHRIEVSSWDIKEVPPASTQQTQQTPPVQERLPSIPKQKQLELF